MPTRMQEEMPANWRPLSLHHGNESAGGKPRVPEKQRDHNIHSFKSNLYRSFLSYSRGMIKQHTGSYSAADKEALRKFEKSAAACAECGYNNLFPDEESGHIFPPSHTDLRTVRTRVYSSGKRFFRKP